MNPSEIERLANVLIERGATADAALDYPHSIWVLAAHKARVPVPSFAIKQLVIERLMPDVKQPFETMALGDGAA